MKTRIELIIFTCAVVFSTSVSSVFAQTSGMADVQYIESEVNYDRLSTSGGEAEIKSVYRSSAHNNSTSTATTGKETESTVKEKEPEPPISPISKENLIKENPSKENTSTSQPRMKAEKPAPVTKETVHKQSKNQEETARPKDDSILSFNFLYYIIEKYKLQDIVAD